MRGNKCSVCVTVETNVLEESRRLAEAEGKSLSSFVNDILNEYLKERRVKGFYPCKVCNRAIQREPNTTCEDCTSYLMKIKKR
jgi:predicted nucleic acid-binding Zn ribbon protein